MKRYLFLFSLLLISMHVSAETISVFAQASYQSSDDARPIVEWFHGPEDETFVVPMEDRVYSPMYRSFVSLLKIFDFVDP